MQASQRLVAAPQRKFIPAGQLLINGRWRAATDGATMATFDPTTEERITDVAQATPAYADEAVQAASEALESGSWSRLHHEARAKILFRIADLLDERADEFAIREAKDMGMPYRDFRFGFRMPREKFLVKMFHPRLRLSPDSVHSVGENGIVAPI